MTLGPHGFLGDRAFATGSGGTEGVGAGVVAGGVVAAGVVAAGVVAAGVVAVGVVAGGVVAAGVVAAGVVAAGVVAAGVVAAGVVAAGVVAAGVVTGGLVVAGGVAGGCAVALVVTPTAASPATSASFQIQSQGRFLERPLSSGLGKWRLLALVFDQGVPGNRCSQCGALERRKSRRWKRDMEHLDRRVDRNASLARAAL